MLLMLMMKKATAVFPLYTIFVILNVTPNVFGSNGSWIKAKSPIVRLDGAADMMQSIVINRVVCIVLSVAFLVLSCKIYKRMKSDLRKGITL